MHNVNAFFQIFTTCTNVHRLLVNFVVILLKVVGLRSLCIEMTE